MIRQFLLSAAGLAIGLGGWPLPGQAQFGRDWDFRVDGGPNAERCSDLRVRASGALAQDTQNYTISQGERSGVEIDARDHSMVYVRGWDRPDYSVEVCRYAGAGTTTTSDQALGSISVTRNGGRFTAIGPPGPENNWRVVFFVHAPRDASLNLETGNGPIEAAEVTGKLTMHATNGPLSLDRCSGTIDAETTNGPISMSGGSGDVRLQALNGPISLVLPDEVWNGSQLEARTSNGPLSVRLPNGFRSGLRVETSGYAPISCGIDACQSAQTEGNRFFPRMIELNGSGDVVHLSTHNGPVSVGNLKGSRRVL